MLDRCGLQAVGILKMLGASCAAPLPYLRTLKEDRIVPGSERSYRDRPAGERIGAPMRQQDAC
jgi:hypothetical protein